MNEPLPSDPNSEKTTVGDAMSRGAEAAKKVSSEILPMAKSAARKLSYGVAYGTAFGGSFAVNLIKEMTPKTLKEGFADGAGAGKQAATNLMAPKQKSEGSVEIDTSVQAAAL